MTAFAQSQKILTGSTRYCMTKSTNFPALPYIILEKSEVSLDFFVTGDNCCRPMITKVVPKMFP